VASGDLISFLAFAGNIVLYCAPLYSIAIGFELEWHPGNKPTNN